MFLKITFSFVAMLLLTQISWGKSFESCSTIDLRSELGPARDQGITMWCYAHSAADLITQKLGKRVSAFDLAATYLLADENTVLQSKNKSIQEALKADANFLNRLVTWRRDEMSSYDSEKILTEFGLYFLGGMEQDAILLSANKGYCLDKNLSGSDQAYKAYLFDLQKFAKVSCQSQDLNHCNWPAPMRMGEVVTENSKALASLFQTWVDKKCGTRVKPIEPILTLTVDVAESLEEYSQKLNNGELNRYDVQNFLFSVIDKSLEAAQVTSIGYDLADIMAPESPTEPQMDHSSVVAARKMINNKCHYFVRTHMGNNCDYLDKVNFKCEANAGGIWLSKEDLPSIYAVVKIKK